MEIHVCMCVYSGVCIHTHTHTHTQIWWLSRVWHLQLCGLQPAGLFGPWTSQARILEWVCHFLLQGIFPTQESNLGLLHCRQILYQLSYEGSPYKLMDGNICSCNHPWILLIGKNIVYQLLFIILFFLRFSFPFLTLTNILESNSIC